MVNIIQKEDLNPLDFVNDDTNAAGGVDVRRATGSSVFRASQPRTGLQDPRGDATAVPVVPPIPAPSAVGDSPWYVQEPLIVAGDEVRPPALWFWDGTEWQPQSGILDIRNDGPIFTAYNGANEPVAAWFGEQIDPDDPPVILNNPIIYIRRDTGQWAPPIETQDDLTVANAFNSFNAVRNFMTRANVIGVVTLDVRGDFSQAGDPAAGSIGPAQFKNAQNIVVRGDPAAATAFKLPWGGGGNRNYGLTATGGSVILRDATLVAEDVSTTATNNTVAGVSANNSLLTLEGTIRFEGYYNQLRAGASSSYLVYPGANGTIRLENNVTLEFAQTGVVLNFASIPAGGVVQIGGNVTFDIQQALTLNNSGFFVSSGANVNLGTNPAAPNPLAVTGAARLITPYSFRVNDLGVVFSAGYSGRPATIAYDFGMDTVGGVQAEMLVAPVGVVNNQAGP